MAIGTYDELKTAVASWMHRTDLAGTVEDFIVLAEQDIKALLAMRLRDVKTTVPTVAGTPTIPAPANLIAFRSISVPNIRPPLSYQTPDQFNREFVDQNIGSPTRYTIIGDLVYLGPTPDAVYQLSLVYEAKFEPLSGSNTTNYVLTNWPNVYLWGALKEAANFARNDKYEAIWSSKFQAAVTAANELEWHSGGPMRVRSDTATP